MQICVYSVHIYFAVVFMLERERVNCFDISLGSQTRVVVSGCWFGSFVCNCLCLYRYLLVMCNCCFSFPPLSLSPSHTHTHTHTHKDNSCFSGTLVHSMHSRIVLRPSASSTPDPHSSALYLMFTPHPTPFLPMRAD